MTFRERFMNDDCNSSLLYTINELLTTLEIDRSPETCRALGFTPREIDLWRKIGTDAFVNYLEKTKAANIKNGKTPYVVCFDARWTRGGEVMDTSRLSDDEINPDNLRADATWQAIEYNMFVDIIVAQSDDEACSIAERTSGYDKRCMFAIPIRKFN